MIDSRQRSVPSGTTRSRPPRLCARIDTASCTSTLTESFHDPGVSKPRSEVRSDGQSGRLEAPSSTILTWSASSTAILANLRCSPPRCCLTTISPGAATSSTMQKGGSVRVPPHTDRTPSCGNTPRWMPGRSTAGATFASASGESGSRRPNIIGCGTDWGATSASEIVGT